jgi:hypothetical protein
MKPQVLETLLQNVSGASFISIDTITQVKLTGGMKNPLQGRVTKVTIGSNVMVFQNKNSNAYENMVNRRLDHEGNAVEFTVGPRAWGKRVPNTPFVEHNGQSYLEVIFLKAGKTQFCVDGTPFNGVIDGLIASSEGEQGGLFDKVIIRTIKTDNVKAITINKQRYVE